MAIRQLNTLDPNFEEQFSKLVAVDSSVDPEITKRAEAIVDDVKKRGDEAVLEYTNRFDGTNFTSMDQLIIPQEKLQEAYQNLPEEQKDALRKAADRIRKFHEREVDKTWMMEEPDGTKLGVRYGALDSVGLYVPGGKAAYPSSVLMNAMPAHVAGVKKIVMVVPTPGGTPNQLVLAAAGLAGVSECYAVGGAQAIAAMAFGTKTIPAVDKIVGPGNAYVAAAKRYVFGTVGIDMIAGPSEILVICDGKTQPDWIAMDLFSQAEHDELAQAILLTPDAKFADEVQKSVKKQLPTMSREKVISASLKNRGAIVVTQSIEEACKVADRIAPEHLELSVENPWKYVDLIHHAGALFLGPYTCEALGDYCAGPNHVLPTSRTARFSSPLGVWDFQKRTSVLDVSKKGAVELGKIADVLARGEFLTAHSGSAMYRVNDLENKKKQ
ncbi:MAG: histidinol dehydrogenase [Burkholderiales bacterium]|nr:histidinol dehydrogenase [Burkholderiales bacterium]